MISFWQQCIGVFKGQFKPVSDRRNKKPAQRKYPRFPVALAASYGFNGKTNGTCQLCNISAQGMAIKVDSADNITLNNNLKIFISFPSRPEPVSALLNVRWVHETDSVKDFSCIAGGTLTFTDTRAKTSVLEYAYTNWYRNAV